MKVLNNTPQIIFAGEEHGGIAAFKSLQATFDSIEVLSEDDNILRMMRKDDIRVNSFLECQSSVGVCAAYRPLIGKDVLSKKTIINTHPSLLPKYRGVHALAWAMLNLEEELGFSIHLMNEYIDDGDILEQFKVKYDNQTAREMLDLFNDYVVDNLGRVVHEYMNGKITPVKQNREQATWVAKRNLNDCVIDFNQSNRQIEVAFKVLSSPYPCPMLKLKDGLFEVLDHRLLERDYDTHIGRVVNIEDDDVYIKTKDGLLIINTLRDYGSKQIILARKKLKRGQRLFQTCARRFCD